MILLGQEGKNFLFRHPDGLIRNHIQQVRNADLFGSFLEPFSNLFFEDLGHPDQSLEPAVSDQPLSLGDIVFAVAHKPGRDRAAAHRTRQGGEFHSAGGHSHKIAVDGHDAVAHGKNRGDAFAAAAGGHRIVDQTVEVVVVDLLTGGLEDEIIDPFPLAQFRIDDLSLLERAGWGRWD